jgi:hypothetical protein
MTEVSVRNLTRSEAPVRILHDFGEDFCIRQGLASKECSLLCVRVVPLVSSQKESGRKEPFAEAGVERTKPAIEARKTLRAPKIWSVVRIEFNEPGCC